MVTNVYAYKVETKEKLKLPELNNQLQQVPCGMLQRQTTDQDPALRFS